MKIHVEKNTILSKNHLNFIQEKSFPERATMHYYARVVLQFILQVLFYL